MVGFQSVAILFRRVDVRDGDHSATFAGKGRCAMQGWVVVEAQVLSEPHHDVGLRGGGLDCSAASGARGPAYEPMCVVVCFFVVLPTWHVQSWVRRHRGGSSRGWGRQRRGARQAPLVLQVRRRSSLLPARGTFAMVLCWTWPQQGAHCRGLSWAASSRDPQTGRVGVGRDGRIHREEFGRSRHQQRMIVRVSETQYTAAHQGISP